MELLISWDRGQSTELKVLTEGLRGLVKNAQPTADLQKEARRVAKSSFHRLSGNGPNPGQKTPTLPQSPGPHENAELKPQNQKSLT
jgi:hypothetical protein